MPRGWPLALPSLILLQHRSIAPLVSPLAIAHLIWRLDAACRLPRTDIACAHSLPPPLSRIGERCDPYRVPLRRLRLPLSYR